MDNAILTQLSMIYSKVVKIKNSDIYLVVDNGKANLIKSDGTSIFSKCYSEISDNKDYIKVIDTTDKSGVAGFVGLYFKITGNVKELNHYYMTKDIDKYIIIENINYNYVEIMDKSTGEEIWAGKLKEYTVRLGDRVTPICLIKPNGEKIVLRNKELKSLNVHLREYYDFVEKENGKRGKYRVVCKYTGEEFKLTEYGQKY